MFCSRASQIIRLQGFDKGIFGGNFHTHNSLHLPPGEHSLVSRSAMHTCSTGLDVVCYSNGPDYARGMRYALRQAAAGRIVMSVDSTNLLNNRHLHGADDAWRFPMTNSNEGLSFEHVRTYGGGADLALVTYGNGVLTALQARKWLIDVGEYEDVAVIDSPLLSSVSHGLRQAVQGFHTVIFVDVCKQGQQPLASHVMELRSDRLLPSNWDSVAAARTYNPLGSTVTFTSIEDILQAVYRCKHTKNSPLP